MKFGAVTLDEAIGGIAVHTVRHADLVIKKGVTVTAAHVEHLRALQIEHIVVARLEAGDVAENEAAHTLATAFAGANLRLQRPFTGRCNVFATCAGLLLVDTPSIDGVNEADERLTVATLPAWRQVADGEMVATIKVIPYAVPAQLLAAVAALARRHPLRVAAFSPLRVGVISTLLPGLKGTVIDKTLRVLEQRLRAAQATIVRASRVAHETTALAAALAETASGCDIVVVFGASAIADRRDVIPAALEAVGGEIEQMGMPVDPGNLLLVGRLMCGGRAVQVLGAPGCARSPKENGFDWVLNRLLAGMAVTSRDIRRMGVGGLLSEIPHRGQARAGDGKAPQE